MSAARGPVKARPRSNPYENENRSARLAMMLDAYDLYLIELGKDDDEYAAQIADDLRRWPAENWAALDARVGFKTPSSDTTRSDFIRTYDERAKRFADWAALADEIARSA